MSSKFQKNIINNILCKIIQAEKNFKYRAMFKCMKLLGFSPEAIRKAVVAAAGIKMESLADDQVSLPVLYGAYNGYRNSGKKAEMAMVKMAAFFDIEPSEFWEDIYQEAA